MFSVSQAGSKGLLKISRSEYYTVFVLKFMIAIINPCFIKGLDVTFGLTEEHDMKLVYFVIQYA